MTDEELKKIKEELMEPDWTENMHRQLEELDPGDSKKIVESLTDAEIDEKINVRRHQQDYISQYIAYLWEISELAFWRHVIISLDINEGILWSDNMVHIQKMCELRIPDDVLKAAMDFAIGCNENNEMDIEPIGSVIKAQVEKFNRLEEIEDYVKLLDPDKQAIAKERIPKLVNSTYHYDF